MAIMNLQDILFSQGFGTRRVCAGLVQQGLVTVAGRLCQDTLAEFETTGLQFTVQGKAWPFHERAYLMLHKPAGYECSQKPGMYPSIYTLLPAPLRQRPQKAAVQGVQAVGRLDQDTTGMLLLTVIGFGHKAGNAYRWLNLGPVNVQPAEVAKLLPKPDAWGEFLSGLAQRLDKDRDLAARAELRRVTLDNDRAQVRALLVRLLDARGAFARTSRPKPPPPAPAPDKPKDG